MKRSGFANARPARPVRDPDEFSSFTPRPRQAVMATPRDIAQPAAPILKTPQDRGRAIRDSAKGEACTVRIVGVCTGKPEHTIWSHAPLGAAGKGRGLKSLDICGAYACAACDAALDQATGRPAGMTREQVLLDWCLGHLRSLVLLRQKGLI